MTVNNCCGNSEKCSNDSKAMYSVDYDSLIEDLTHTRDEIDTLINTLKARKNKDKTINDILSSDYEDDCLEEDDDKSELDKLLEDIMKDTPIYPYPYRYHPNYYWISKSPYKVWF